MDKIFEQAKDLHVVATYVYNNGSDVFAYVDAECTIKFKTSELKEVFLKGALIKIGDDLMKPVSFGVDSSKGQGGIGYIKNTEEGITLDALVAEADEEEAE